MLRSTNCVGLRPEVGGFPVTSTDGYMGEVIFYFLLVVQFYRPLLQASSIYFPTPDLKADLRGLRSVLTWLFIQGFCFM